MLMLPGDASMQEIEQLRQKLGFNDPLYVQYARFASHAVRGDFGESLYYHVPALDLIMERLPASLETLCGGPGHRPCCGGAHRHHFRRLQGVDPRYGEHAGGSLRSIHAPFLAGNHAHHGLFRESRLASHVGSRQHGAAHHAFRGAGPQPDGHVRAPHALRHAGSFEPGLHSYGTRQGRERSPGGRKTRTQERPDSTGHGCGHAVRHAHRRHGS